jgi:hypothetical protein
MTISIQKLKTNCLYFLFIFLTLSLRNCRPTAEWSFDREISLDNVKPVGLAIANKQIWISDVLNNRIITIDFDGNQLRDYPNFRRPMHISNDGLKIYVPEYLSDKIKVIEQEKVDIIKMDVILDAPSGVVVQNNIIAIADFFNHRIILKDVDDAFIFGKQGHGRGELYYPTDVEIHGHLIFVADAYNNRVQIFTKNGDSVRIIAEKEKIKAALGIEIYKDQLFVTDFENSRILIYELNGKLLNSINTHLDHPTDLVIEKDTMYIINHGGSSISVFERD